MKRTIGLEIAFDRIFDLYEEDVPASDETVSEITPVSHIARIVGIINHNIAKNDGAILIEFFRDHTGLEPIAEFVADLEPSQHIIDIIPIADYMKITIANSGGSTKQVSTAIAGHYGPHKT